MANLSLTKTTPYARANRINPAVLDDEWWNYAMNQEYDTLTLLAKLGVNVPEPKIGEIVCAMVLARLRHYPDYYQRLKYMQDELIQHWRSIRGDTEE